MGTNTYSQVTEARKTGTVRISAPTAPDGTREITSNKAAIIVQAAAIVVVFALIAAGVEYSGLLRSSLLGRLSATVGLPVAGLAVGLVGVLIAWMTTVDSWNFRARIGDTGLEIVEHLGRTRVQYSNIAALKVIPAYGAGIALNDKEEWLSSFAGRDSDRAKLDRISGVLAVQYGCEVAFVNKRLRCGSRKFLELLSEKTGIAVS
jgi:hypothetical protein